MKQENYQRQYPKEFFQILPVEWESWFFRLGTRIFQCTGNPFDFTLEYVFDEVFFVFGGYKVFLVWQG